MTIVAPWIVAMAVAGAPAPSVAAASPDAAVCLNADAASQARVGACTRMIEAPGAAIKDLARYRAARATAFYAMKRYGEAEIDTSTAILADPAGAGPGAYFTRALTRLALERPAEAKADYDSLLRLKPDDSAALYNRALIEADAGDHTSALKDLELARKLAPKDVETVVELGVEYGANKRPDDELACYAAALALEPKDRTALLNRAIAYFRRKDWPNAERAITSALAAFPNDAPMHEEAGAIADERGDKDRAMAEYNQSLSLDSTDLDARRDRAELEWSEKAYGKAAADYAVIVALSPGDAEAADNLLSALIEDGHDKLAMPLAEAALKRAPQNVDLLIAYGRLLAHADRNDEALAAYTAAIKIDPTSDPALYDRALVFVDEDHPDRAIRDLDAALRAKPGDADDLEERATIYLGQEDYAMAIADLDAVIAGDPKRVSAYEKRADAHRKQGDSAAAAADESMIKTLKRLGR
jgi:tetratricopeptide (TPR) repeat protein